MEVVVKRGLSGLQQGGAGGEEEGRGGCLCTRWTEWILTGGVAISSRLVRALSRNLVDVVFFDGRGEPVAMLFPPDSNGVAAHRRAQYEAYFNGRGLSWLSSWSTAKLRTRPGPSDAPASEGGSGAGSLQKPRKRWLG